VVIGQLQVERGTGKSLLVKDQRSTIEPHNQPVTVSVDLDFLVGL